MTTTESPIVVGVFRDRALAQQAIDELRHSGFRDDQISLLGQGASSGGLVETIMSKFSGQGNATDHLYDDLIAQGMSEEEAHYYQGEAEAGRSIVMVQSYGHQQEARDILHHHGAYNASTGLGQIINEQIVPLRQEELQAHKQLVQTGEVRLRKKVITEQKTITVSVMREELVVERHPFTASTDQTDQQPDQSLGKIIEIGEGETFTIPLRAEQVTVMKQPVVIEEVILGKRQIQETKHISDTVRREEAYFHRQGDIPVQAKGVEEVANPSESGTQTT
jgi:uncharacterized protein (TIGR02271 family)